MALADELRAQFGTRRLSTTFDVRELKRLHDLILIREQKTTSEKNAKLYDCVSICFADMVGFTELSSRMSPIEVQNAYPYDMSSPACRFIEC